jgi:hypothetical protein
MDLKPRESRVIRVVSHAALPYPAQEGRPYCEFVVTDAEDNEYTLPLTATASPGSGNRPALMRLHNLAMRGRVLREEIQGAGRDSNPPSDPDQRSQEYEYWVTKVAQTLKPWPDLREQFQVGRTAATDRDPALFVERTELLETMLHNLDDHRRQDAELLTQVRSLLAEGRSRQGELDRAPTGTVPPGLPEHVEGWETNVRRTLASRLDLCALFDRAPFATTQDIPGTLSNRLRERLRMLEAMEGELIGGQHQD